MCGIYGVWRRDGGPVDLMMVQTATNIMRHRGPDDEGYLLIDTHSGRVVHCGGPDTDPRLSLAPIASFRTAHFDLALGFRRLAIIDLSPAGHQPMCSSDARFWLVFNGEVYNYPELRSTLSGLGHSFRSRSDSEVVLAAYQQWGAACLPRFNGMWAFAIWDTQDRTLFLARDRFGIKPLHMASNRTVFRFASELKALVGPHGLPFVPNDPVIFDYLTLGVLPNPQEQQTFFAGVQGMPPAHALTVSPESETLQRYWQVEPGVGAADVPDVVAGELRAQFTDAVRLRLRADVPVGTCLSGGLDSSSIVAVLGRLMCDEHGLVGAQLGAQQKSFSAVYRRAGRFNERQYIDMMVAHTDIDAHFTYPEVEHLLHEMERLIWHQDEPFQGTSMFAQWCVMERVKESGVVVLLDGQGADEMLAGYRPFWVYLAEQMTKRQYRRAWRETRAIRATTGMPLRTLAFHMLKAAAWQLPPALLNPMRSLRRRRTVWGSLVSKQAAHGVLNPAFARAYGGRFVSEVARANVHTLDDYNYNAVFNISLPHLLRYEDRNAMAFSIEARVPFLDYRFVNYAFGPAARWCIHDGWTKWIFRHAMDDILPPAITWRRDKVGFETPEQDWLYKIGRARQACFTSDAPVSAYLDVDTVRAILGSKVPSRNEALRRWRWVNLENWLRLW